MSTLLACDIGRKDSKRTGEGGMLSVLSRIYTVFFGRTYIIIVHITWEKREVGEGRIWETKDIIK